MGNIVDQPPPILQPGRVPVWLLVIEDCATKPGPTWDAIRDDMRERDKLGRERYGTPLTTHNGRDHLVDAYQEALDLAVYLRAELQERLERGAAGTTRMRALYHRHLDNLHLLRSCMRERSEDPALTLAR